MATPAPLVDHLVLPVNDLVTARKRFKTLGFQVSPDALHPFGTANCRVFFANRTYLEPIATADPDALARGIGDGLVFLQRIEEFRRHHGEGFAMVAMKSADAAADRARFEAAGMVLGDTFSLVGKTRDESGAERDYGVHLSFSGVAEGPDATLFACQPIGSAAAVNDGTRFVQHPNTARGVVHVIAVAAEPGRFVPFVSAASGREKVRQTPARADWDFGNAAFSILTPAMFLADIGYRAPDPGEGLRLAAFDVGVASIDLARESIGTMGSEASGGRLVVPPADGQGAFIGFVEVEMPEQPPRRRPY